MRIEKVVGGAAIRRKPASPPDAAGRDCSGRQGEHSDALVGERPGDVHRAHQAGASTDP
jgi:hypothetical protein